MKVMTNKEYHAHHAISNTQLSMFHKDQYAIDWQKECPVDTEKIKAFDFGDAMHAICLEPERFSLEYTFVPEVFDGISTIGQSKVAKEARADFAMQNSYKKILSTADHYKLQLMFESVMAHPYARKLIEARGRVESSWFWTDKDTGVECRCRPDKLIENLLVDVKTTPELEKFHYSVDDYRYFVQNAFYCDGLEANGIEDTRMEFLVIQKSINCGRYPVTVCELPGYAVDFGRAEYKKDLENYARYLDGHRAPTIELEMAYNFNKKVDESLGEVSL